MELIPLLTAIIGLVVMILTIATGPSAKERQKKKEKSEIDDAIRKEDKITVADILSRQRDRLAHRLHENKDHP